MIEFGYVVNDSQIVIDEKMRGILIRMHELFIEEESYFSVLDYLNSMGIHWTRNELKKILGNEVYRGNHQMPRLLSDEIIDQTIQIKESKSLQNAKKYLPKSKLTIIRPMNKRMIVLDLDKTLLNHESKITDYTLKVLEKVRESGCKIVIATGRAITRSRKYMHQIGADGLITLNGSVVYAKEKIIAQYPIDQQKVYELVQRLMSIDGMSMGIAYPDYMITSNPKFAVPGINDYNDMKEFPLDEIQNIKAFSLNHDAMNQIDYDSYGCRKITSIKEPEFHVIASKDVDKMKGIEVLAAHFGIEIADVISFGDDYNDLMMLKKCGTGVAMANASEMVKDVADEITLSNEEDGVGVWLNQYFQLELTK